MVSALRSLGCSGISPGCLRKCFSHYFFTVTERPERRRLLGHASAAVRRPGQSGLPGAVLAPFPPLEGVLASACTQDWTGRKMLESSLLFPLSGWSKG